MDAYLQHNRDGWNARASAHTKSSEYCVDQLVSDPEFLSGVVRFDEPRLGDISGLDVLHMQCHIGTDTLSLSKLGATVSGLDLSNESIKHAREITEAAGHTISYHEADVYSAPEVLGHSQFDLVYTGIGALCWLPDMTRWAETVAKVLRPGGRLFVREGHPMLGALGTELGEGAMFPLEYPYHPHTEPIIESTSGTYVPTDEDVPETTSYEWTHSLGEVVMALLGAGFRLDLLEEHDSAPWNALPGQMVMDEMGEYRLKSEPERLAATFTVSATLTVKPANWN